MHRNVGFASRFATATSSSSSRLASIAVAFAVLLALFVTTGPWALSPAAAADDSILGTSTPVRLVQHTDTSGVEVGTRFTARSNGTATGMRFWKIQDADGPHTGTLWNEQGEKLTGATFSNETGSGWQMADFDRNIALTAGATYVVSYYAANGRYAATYDYTGKSRTPDLTITAGSGVFMYGSTTQFPTDTYRNSEYWVDVDFVPTPTAVPTPTPTPAPTPPPAATRTPSAGFPSAETTGVPQGTTLAAYTGPCRITKPDTVIDAKRVNCWPLEIQAQGVVIARSLINGIIYTDEHGVGSFTITDSEVNVGQFEGTGIGDARFTATRVHVTGGNRSVNCFLDCTIEDSYAHGQFRDETGRAHESGIRMGSNAVIRGNTIACDAPNVPPDAGCSAALTGYGDFAAVRNNTIDGNLFVGGSGGYCAYGGSTGGKPFSSGTRDIRFINNVWQRGASGNCGFWGPITSFDSDAPGNVWSNNLWEDGTPVGAAN